MSRRLQPKTAHMIVFDLREAARKHCPKAIAVVAKCLDSEDEWWCVCGRGHHRAECFHGECDAPAVERNSATNG